MALIELGDLDMYERKFLNDPPRPKKAIGLTVYMTEATRDLLVAAAARRKMSASGYLRSLVAVAVGATAAPTLERRQRDRSRYFRRLAGARKIRENR